MAAQSTSLKEYLKKYHSTTDDQSTKKKMKKKKAKSNPKPTAAGVLVVDEDPVWGKPIQEDAEEEESGEELPQIDEDVEVKRMKRLEALRSRRPYHMISDDGSGWISVPNQSENLNRADRDGDLSPPRQRRARRFDTPSPEREGTVDGDRDGDLSPPRQRRRRFDTPSPDRKRNVDGDRDGGDMSPPRQQRRRLDTPSPERRVGEDLSPPRRKSNEDSSPPRRNRNRSPDLSPLRRRKEVLLSREEDLLPPGRKREPSLAEEEDLSPPRRKREPSLAEKEDLSPPRRKREPSLALEVRRTGLLSAEEIRKVNEKKRKEEIARFFTFVLKNRSIIRGIYD